MSTSRAHRPHEWSARTSCVAALLMMCCLLAACEGKGRGPIRIGVALREHGTLGASLALAEVNARGGVRGRPLEIRYERPAVIAPPGEALEFAERFAGDLSVVAVVGHERSNASLAASQIYNERGLVQIAPNTSAPLYGRAGSWSFGLVPSDVHQGAFLAREILRRSPRPRVAILYNSGDYGSALRGSVVSQMRAGGATPVYDAPFDDSEVLTDRIELAAAVGRARPDLLLWVGGGAFFMLLQPELRARLPRLQILGSDAFGGPEVALDGGRALGGVRYVRLLGLDRSDARFQELSERYARAGGGLLTDQGALAYDAVLLLAEAIDARGPDRSAIREWLAAPREGSPAFRGVSGPIPFPLAAFRQAPYVIDEVATARTVPMTGRDSAVSRTGSRR